MADRAVQVAPPVVIGALVSGTGRSVANLHAAIERGEVSARIAVVVATRADVPALARCRTLGIATEVVPVERRIVAPPGAPVHDTHAAPGAVGESFDDRLDRTLQQHGVELVCLCGYLRMFRVAAWRGRAVNMHPALLPDFGGAGMFGLHVHRAVLAAGALESGCTAHWVDEQYDHGPTITQARCPVLPGDTPEALAERVFHLECTVYPRAVAEAARAVRAGRAAAS